jgi:acetyl esterase/lipase
MKNLIALACAVLCVAVAPAALAQSAEIPLWQHSAPGPRAPAGAETVRVSPEGDHVVANITRPSITPYLPAPDQATGAAVIIAPGGGYRELWIDHEGYRVAAFLQAHGVAAFVLKYRLPSAEGSPYAVDDALTDMRRAIRTVRARAAEWHVRPDAVGVMGFSAGGNLAALATFRAPAAVVSRDPIDAKDGAPNFSALIYPGIPEHDALSAATPPLFLLGGEQDGAGVSVGLAELYLEAKRNGASAELHMLAGVPHGFGVRATNAPQVASWPQTFYDWMGAKGLLAVQPAH